MTALIDKFLVDRTFTQSSQKFSKKVKIYFQLNYGPGVSCFGLGRHRHIFFINLIYKFNYINIFCKKNSYMRCCWPTSCSRCCSGYDIRPGLNSTVDAWHQSTPVWPWGRFWLMPNTIVAFPLAGPSILTLDLFLEFVLILKKNKNKR